MLGAQVLFLVLGEILRVDLRSLLQERRWGRRRTRFELRGVLSHSVIRAHVCVELTRHRTGILREIGQGRNRRHCVIRLLPVRGWRRVYHADGVN